MSKPKERASRIAEFVALLEHSFSVEQITKGEDLTRLQFLGDNIFEFVTYDSEITEEFTARALAVSDAINGRSTVDFIKDPTNYRSYLWMVNLPFFATRIDWGTSIRGAWWWIDSGKTTSIQSCGLWTGWDQVLTLELGHHDWVDFMHAVVAFAKLEVPA